MLYGFDFALMTEFSVHRTRLHKMYQNESKLLFQLFRLRMQISLNHSSGKIFLSLIKCDWFSHSINMNYVRRHLTPEGRRVSEKNDCKKLQSFSSQFNFESDLTFFMIYSKCLALKHPRTYNKHFLLAVSLSCYKCDWEWPRASEKETFRCYY